jgi:hypothetical protein
MRAAAVPPRANRVNDRLLIAMLILSFLGPRVARSARAGTYTILVRSGEGKPSLAARAPPAV